MKTKAFTMIEIVFCLLILSVLIILLLPSFGSIEKSNRIMNEKERILYEAQNVMELAIGHEEISENEYVECRVTPYKEGLEIVEVYKIGTEEKVLEALRPSQGFYAP